MYALTLIIAFAVRSGITAFIDVAFVRSRQREENAGGVVFGAFGVLFAVDEVIAFIVAGAVDGDALLVIVALGVLGTAA